LRYWNALESRLLREGASACCWGSAEMRLDIVCLESAVFGGSFERYATISLLHSQAHYLCKIRE
jgi:hypothetical protein